MKKTQQMLYIFFVATFSLFGLFEVPKDAKYSIHEVKGVKATEKTLQGYGKIVYPKDYDAAHVAIVTWPAQGWRPVEEGTGNEGGMVEGEFSMWWKGNRLYAVNGAVQRKYLTGWSTYPTLASKLPVVAAQDRKYLLTFEANYHPDGGQLFMPKNGKPFVALLALPGDDVMPQDFVAFYFDGSFGVEINPGVWHQPLFPALETAEFKDKQGKVHACIAVNFPEEFGCYLAVPLFEPLE